MTCQSILSSQNIPKQAPSNILKPVEAKPYVSPAYHSNHINSLLSHELELSSNLISTVNSTSNIRSNQQQQQVNPVKRPVNAFILWSQQERRKLTDSGLLLSDAESNSIGSVSKRLGLKWRLMSKEEKQPYVLEAERLKQVHRIQHPDYKFSRSTTTARNKRFKHSTESSLVTSSASSVNAGDDLYYMSSSSSSSMYMQQPSPYSVHSSSDYHLNSVESESTVDVDDLDISNFEFDSTGFENLMNAFDFNHPHQPSTTTTVKNENNYVDGHFDNFNQVGDFADLDRLLLPITAAEYDNNNTAPQTTTNSIEHSGSVLHPQMSIDVELLNQSNFNTTIKQNMLDNSSLVITPPIDNDIVI